MLWNIKFILYIINFKKVYVQNILVIQNDSLKKDNNEN